MKSHLASRVLMVRPKGFCSNPETLASNSFQSSGSELPSEEIQNRAEKEFLQAVSALQSAGVIVDIYAAKDDGSTPDALFPNNWFSTHNEHHGCLVLYPMFAENRRAERSRIIIDSLRNTYPHVIDLSPFENKGMFLEGTGSLVIARDFKIAFASLSPRTSIEAAHYWAASLNYQPVTFNARTETGQPIYHTNVLMSIGRSFAVFCAETVADETEKEQIKSLLTSLGRELILISIPQMNLFCGNIIEIANSDGESIIVMSESARRGFNTEQLRKLERHGKIVSIDIPIIERFGGGSARCMIAELF